MHNTMKQHANVPNSKLDTGINVQRTQGYEYGGDSQDRPRTDSSNNRAANGANGAADLASKHTTAGAHYNPTDTTTSGNTNAVGGGVIKTTSPNAGAEGDLESGTGTPKVQIDQKTKDKAASAKAYIENKYAKAKYEERERKEAWDKLNTQMKNMRLSE